MYPCNLNLNGQHAGCFIPASASASASASSVHGALQTAGLPALTPTTNSFIGVHPSRPCYHIFAYPLIQPKPDFFQIFLGMNATSTLRRPQRRPRTHLVSLSDREIPRAALPTFIQLVLNTTLRPLRRSPCRRLFHSQRQRRWRLHTALDIKPRGLLSPLVRSLAHISPPSTSSSTPKLTMTISPSVILPAPRIRLVDLTSLALPLLARGHPRPVKLPCRPSCSLASPPSNSESSRMLIPVTSRLSWTSLYHTISVNEAIFPPKNCRLSTSPFPISAMKATSKALAVVPRVTPVAGTPVLRRRLIGQSRGVTICSTIFEGTLV